jgi:hypothetical protein
MRVHGTRSKYNAGCHCDACRRANTLYERGRIRHAAYRAAGGEPPLFVDAEPARRYLEGLRARGLGWRRIQEVTGVAGSTVHAVLSGRRTRIRRDTERVLLSVDDAEPADGTLTSPDEALAIIDRMISRGWRRYQIAAALGSTAKVPALQVARREHVTRMTLRRLRVLERLAEREALSFTDAKGAMVSATEVPPRGVNLRGRGHTYRGGEASG